MRNLRTFATSLALMATACEEKKATVTAQGPSPGSPAAPTGGTLADTLAGTLMLGLAPKDGESLSTVAGARVVAEGHPEIEGKADAQGNVTLTGILPGTLTLYALSAIDGAALTATSPRFGLKLDGIVVKAGQTTDLGKKALQENGGLTGTVDFYDNPNNQDLTGTDVYVPGTSFIAKTDAAGRFSLAGLPPGTYTLRMQHTGFASVTLKDVTIAEGAVTDIGAVPLSLSTGPEGAIDVAADQVSVIGGKSRKVLLSRTVQVGLTYDRDAALMKISDEPTFLGKDWRPVQPTLTWGDCTQQGQQDCWTDSLAGVSPEPDGLKKLYVMFADLNGLESSPAVVPFYVETETPTLSKITLLNGWAQTASLRVFVDVEATDASTGIKEIQFMGCTPVGATPGAWTPFSPHMDCDLTAGGDGVRAVTAKVRDYANRESTVVSASITKDTRTLIHKQSYPNKIVLRKAQEPYLLDDDVTFDGDVDIEAGVRLFVTESKTLKIKGRLRSLGAITEPIVFNQANAIANGTCGLMGGYSLGWNLDLSEGRPGLTAANTLAYTELRTIYQAKFNGGHLSRVTFDGGCDPASGARGDVVKTGLDPLVLDSPHFVAWYTAVNVQQGNGATTLRGATGRVNTVLQQLNSATGTRIENNALELQWGPIYSIGSGTMTLSGNTWSGSVSTVLSASNAQSIALPSLDYGISNGDYIYKNGAGALTIAGGSVTSCNKVLRIQGNATVNLSGLTASGCKRGIVLESGSGTTTAQINVSQSNILVSERLVDGATGEAAWNVSFDGSTVGCTNNTIFCDLFFQEIAGSDLNSTLNLSDSTIQCQGDATKGCRGFVFYFPFTGQSIAPTFRLNLSNNTYSGKSLNPALVTNMVNVSAGWNAIESTVAATGDTDIRVYKAVESSSTMTLGLTVQQ